MLELRELHEEWKMYGRISNNFKTQSFVSQETFSWWHKNLNGVYDDFCTLERIKVWSDCSMKES